MGETMKLERSDGSDLRWKRPETKADESAGVRRLYGGKKRRLTRRYCVKVRHSRER